MDSIAECYKLLAAYAIAREAIGIDSQEFEITEIRKISKAAKEKKAAELLPLGAPIAAGRLGDCKRNIYKLAERWKKRMPKIRENGHS